MNEKTSGFRSLPLGGVNGSCLKWYEPFGIEKSSLSEMSDGTVYPAVNVFISIHSAPGRASHKIEASEAVSRASIAFNT